MTLWEGKWCSFLYCWGTGVCCCLAAVRKGVDELSFKLWIVKVTEAGKVKEEARLCPHLSLIAHMHS